MSRSQNWRPTPSVPNKAMAELQYDIRADGSKMPLLNADGTHMRKYDRMNNERQVEAHLRRIHSAAPS